MSGTAYTYSCIFVQNSHVYPIPQREPLIGIICNRGIHRSMTAAENTQPRDRWPRVAFEAKLLELSDIG